MIFGNWSLTPQDFHRLIITELRHYQTLSQRLQQPLMIDGGSDRDPKEAIAQFWEAGTVSNQDPIAP
jgi:hypothetical protein